MPNPRAMSILKAGAIVLIAFGILFAAAVVPALSYPAVFFLDLAIWPLDGAQSLDSAETRLLCAVGGGMLVGWGALFYLLADQVYPHEPQMVRKFVLISICSWFVVDSLGSIAAGAPMNALFNIGFLALFALPVLKAESPQTQP